MSGKFLGILNSVLEVQELSTYSVTCCTVLQVTT